MVNKWLITVADAHVAQATQKHHSGPRLKRVRDGQCREQGVQCPDGQEWTKRKYQQDEHKESDYFTHVNYSLEDFSPNFTVPSGNSLSR